jgi:hypothetical protein
MLTNESRVCRSDVSSGATDGSARPRTHSVSEVADLHAGRVGDGDRLDLRRTGALVEPGAVAVGARLEGDRPLHEGPHVRLERFDVLGEQRLPHPGDEPLVRRVEAGDLHPDRLVVEDAFETWDCTWRDERAQL